MNYRIKTSIKYINKIYNTIGGEFGGYGYIVFNNKQIDDESIDGCIRIIESIEHYDTKNEDCRISSIEALRHFKKLSIQERISVLNYINL